MREDLVGPCACARSGEFRTACPPTSNRARKRAGLLNPLRLVFLFLLSTLLARAHDAFSSIGNAQVGPGGMQLELTMARSMAITLLLDRAKLPNEITDENFERFLEPLRAQAGSLFSITAGGAALKPKDTFVELTMELDVAFHVSFPPPTKSPLRFHGSYLQKMSDGHVGTLYVEDVSGKSLGWSNLDTLAPDLEVPLPGALTGSNSGEKNPVPVAPPFRAFLKLGVEHIIRGYDHLLFLAGLLLACRRLGTMAGIITCFTLAHSITLALAAFDVVSLPSRIVEPLIAASIVFVGVENLLRRGEEPPRRWLLTFGFGLVHGFGFAGALKAAGLGAGGASLAMPLFSFNLGVEIGQIAVAAVFLPLLLLLRRVPKFVRHGLPLASSVVAILGSYWFLQRTVFS